MYKLQKLSSKDKRKHETREGKPYKFGIFKKGKLIMLVIDFIRGFEMVKVLNSVKKLKSVIKEFKAEIKELKKEIEKLKQENKKLKK